MATVAVVFPPLVESNYGGIYPAGPVLSGFLESHGIPTAQLDLNEDFAEYLILSGDTHPDVPADSLAAAASRWSHQNAAKLIDNTGVHRFGGEFAGPSRYASRAPELMARPYRIEADQLLLEGVTGSVATELAYQRFFTSVDEQLQGLRNAALVGVTVAMGPQLGPALLLAQHLKRRGEQLPKIVLGGATLSLMAESDIAMLLTHHPEIDGVVRYDGEIPLLELAQQLTEGRWEPARVSAFSWQDGDVVRHNTTQPGSALDTLPPPYYPPELVARLGEPVLGVTQARGCYWGKCDYCDFVEVFAGSVPFRGRHADVFVDEVMGLVERTGVSTFRFITESIPPAFARRMSALLIERHASIAWSSFAMVDRRFDRSTLKLMARSGCTRLIVGLETMNTRVLKSVNKSADREANIRFLEDCRSVGLRLTVNVIPDLPSTTYDEAIEGLRDLAQLADCIDSLSVFEFEPTRSSRVGRDPTAFGLVPVTDSLLAGQAQFPLNTAQTVDNAMTEGQRVRVYAAYKSLATSIRSSHTPTEPTAEPSTSGNYRIPVEELDLHVSADSEVVCTQFRTGKRVRLPPSVARLLMPHLDGRTFQNLAAADEDGALATLVRHRVIVAV